MAYVVAGLHYALDRVARDHAYDVAAIHHGHLIDIGAAHAIEQIERGIFRSGKRQPIARSITACTDIIGHSSRGTVCSASTVINPTSWPPDTTRCARLPVRVTSRAYSSSEISRAMVAMSEVMISATRRPVESAACGHLRVALTRNRQQEPANEDQPKSAKHVPAGQVTLRRRPDPNANQAVSDGLPGACRDARGARVIAGNAPDDGAQDAAAIEGKSRDQVEGREHGVDPPELACKRAGHTVVGREPEQQPET